MGLKIWSENIEMYLALLEGETVKSFFETNNNSVTQVEKNLSPAVQASAPEV